MSDPNARQCDRGQGLGMEGERPRKTGVKLRTRATGIGEECLTSHVDTVGKSLD